MGLFRKFKIEIGLNSRNCDKCHFQIVSYAFAAGLSESSHLFQAIGSTVATNKNRRITLCHLHVLIY